MQYFKNPYFSSDNKDFASSKSGMQTVENVKNIKLNNQYLLSIFSAMRTAKTKEQFMNNPIYKNYKNTILAGELYKKDTVTGFNTKKLGEKVKFLVLAFCDESHPENIQKIQQSYFMTDVLLHIFHGGFLNAETNSDERWELYEKVDPAVAKSSALNAALSYYVNDPTIPVGLDFSTIIDTIVKEDRYGNFELVSQVNDLKVNEDIVMAVKAYIALLKSSKKFKANYRNPKIVESEFDVE